MLDWTLVISKRVLTGAEVAGGVRRIMRDEECESAGVVEYVKGNNRNVKGCMEKKKF